MKTYTKQVLETKPRLVIRYDEMAQSPRFDTNLGYFITVDRRYDSPDDNESLYNIVKESGQTAFNQAEHIEIINREYTKESGEKVIAIYPINKLDHSGVVYSLGTKNGFDYSNNGFYVITDKTQKETGVDKKDFEKVIKQELDAYNSYINGNVYYYTLYDEQGEEIDSGSGYYSLKDIKANLGKEWQDEELSDYFK